MSKQRGRHAPDELRAQWIEQGKGPLDSAFKVHALWAECKNAQSQQQAHEAMTRLMKFLDGLYEYELEQREASHDNA